MDELYESLGISIILIKKYFEGRLSESERHELAEWLWRDRKNRMLLERLRSGKNLGIYFKEWKQIVPEQEYNLLVARFPEIGVLKNRKIYYWRWVAMWILLLAGAFTWYMLRSSQSIPAGIAIQDTNVLAVLKTSDGREFRLNGRNSIAIGERTLGLQICDSLKELVCEDLSTTDSLSYHQLDIPKGGEYRLILSDGTKVWLNSESSIRFPGVFGKNERNITLSGEAYFEVAHDKERPFKIMAGGGSVEVLGTSFGMNVYPEESSWSTTLVKGRVRACYGKSSILLTPGKKAYVVANELRETIVDTEKELAWVNGIFLFEHNRLEEVVKKLSRWYNIDFRFDNDRLKENLFTGQVSRDLGVDSILDLIRRMNVVAFEKKEGYILIKEKAGV